VISEAQPVKGGAQPTSGTSPRPTRIIGLDGARGLSCLGVAVMHITNHFTPHTAATWKTNALGLTLIFFYVLSGFLLFLPYVRNLLKDRDAADLPSTKNFAVHRIARILPGYLFIFLVCNYVLRVAYVENAALQPPASDYGTGMITDPWQLIANLTLVHTYIPEYFQTGLNPSWSLTLEYAFYASLPLFGLLMFALRRRTALQPYTIALIATGVLILIGVVGRLLVPLVIAKSGVTDPVLVEWGPNWAAVYLRSILVNADNFAMGMLAAVVFVAMERAAIPARIGNRVRSISVAATCVAIVISGLLIPGRNPFATMVIGLGCGLMILIIVAPLALGQRSKLASILDSAPLRFIGLISLSVYLWHFPLMLMLYRWGLIAGDTLPGMLQNVVVAMAFTILVSTITYYLVERPVMNAAKRYRSKWS
jgi:peptidoglycan/LPS O-acetylase OafA/YrhL